MCSLTLLGEGSSFFSSEEHPHVSDVLHVFLVLPHLDFPSPPMNVVTRPLQVYTLHPRPSTRPFADSSSMPPSSPALVPQPPDDLPIAIRKGTRSTCNPHSVYNFLSYHRLSLPYFALFSSCLLSLSLSLQALVRLFLIRVGNWQWLRKLILFPPMAHGSLSPVGCRWVYTVKVGLDGQVDRLKARLVVKGYTQQ